MRNCFLLFAALFTTQLSVSQTSLSYADSLEFERLKNLPNIEVGKGVSFMPKDSLYKLNLRFRMQNMAAVRFHEDGDIESELMVRRLRLRFEGFVYSPKLIYVIQLGFSGAENRGLAEGDNIIRDAMVYYLPNNRWNFGFGQTKVPASRARLNSSSALQFVDRSMVNAMFNLDRDFGFFATHNTNLFSNFDIVVKTAITSGEGRNFPGSPNAGFAFTARLELFPMGRFKSLGDVFEGDFERERTPKVMLAVAYSANRQALRDAGQRGTRMQNSETRNINSLFVDFIFKYSGFAFYTDYAIRLVENPVIFENSHVFRDQFIFTGQGLNTQASYIFTTNWEVAARFSRIMADNKVQNMAGFTDENQYTFGITRYVIGHSLKFQMDASYHDRNLINGIDKSYFMARFQVELGI